jgi:hypothetical protein
MHALIFFFLSFFMMNMLNKVTTQPRKLALGSIVSYRGCITDGTAKALAAIVLG